METGLFEIEAGHLSHNPEANRLLPGPREVIRDGGSRGCNANGAELWLKAKSKLILKPLSSLGAFYGLLICPILPSIA
jgi:hypothetical protein